MKPIHYASLTLLGAVWGASFLLIGVAAPAVGPPALMLQRVLIAGLLMAGVATLSRGGGLRATLRLGQMWRAYLFIGLFNAALPFTLIAFSELRLPASLAAILNSTTPLFTALAAAAWGSERLTGRKIAGVLLGMAGVAVLVGGAPLALDRTALLAVGASLLAALSYGVATVYAARRVTGLPAAYASTAQLLAAAVWLAVPAALAWPDTPPPGAAVAALAALILLSTTFAYLLYFYLLRHVGPTRTASVTFLVPLFGALWSVLFLDEQFSLGMAVGLAIILVSVGLVLGRRVVTSEE
jgi:drug/metabolite transporter (DMT)-like permease